ncbi:MAG: SDR family NAD(P)-dependent oxidoreductase [Acidobacteria bacterium]|nr:SDR family NAD(P)-dependent oxidoreductase [Acidobacteriota bacterium]
MKRKASASSGPVALITGGAGFIGTNLAARLAEDGRQVRIFDNLSRPGVERNLLWLRDTYGDRIEIALGDIRDRASIDRFVQDATEVYHFAAQVAVTSSLDDPVHDFAVNAGGTLNLLEALRALDTPPPLIFTSTNKVYGDLEDVELVPDGSRYIPADTDTRMYGISEERPVNFHSPYGCSKGAADQYVLDYARTFHMPAVVFRMSCIYGPHQFGTEDQGWLAHFLIRAMKGQAITIYGDGLQVRDVLFVEDLVRAFLLARDRIDTISGQAFNMGGGATRTTSLVELIELIAQLEGRAVQLQFDAWREADQRYYVSNTSRFQEATGWKPRVSVEDGVRALHRWLQTMQAPAQVQVPAVTATVAG